MSKTLFIKRFTNKWTKRNREGRNKVLKSLTLQESELQDILNFCSLNDIKLSSLIYYIFSKNDAFPQKFLDAWGQQKEFLWSF